MHNPRYAGLAATREEVVGRGHWPPYISVRQYHRLQDLIAQRWHKRRKSRKSEAFLLGRIARCGMCRPPLHCQTGDQRQDGTLARRYVCRSHRWGRHAGRCNAVPLDADVIEMMLVSTLRHLLLESSERSTIADVTETFEGHWLEAPEREQIRDAV